MKKTIAVAVTVLLMMTTFALAANEGGPVSTVLSDVIELVAYALGLALAALLANALRWIAAKFKMQMPQAWMSNVNVWVDKAINYAEEWAKNKVKTNETVNSNEKLNTAIAFLLASVDDKKLLAMSKEEITKLIEARLGEHRGIKSDFTAMLEAPIVDVKLLAISETTGNAVVHLTNGVELDITSILKDAGYVRAQEKLPLTEKKPEAGSARVGAMVMIALIFGSIVIGACSWWKGGGAETTRAAILDCTTKNATSLTKEFGGLYELAIVKATGGDGKVDWAQVKDVTKDFAIDSGMCVANNVIGDLLKRVVGIDGGHQGITFDHESLALGIQRGDAKVVKTLHGDL